MEDGSSVPITETCSPVKAPTTCSENQFSPNSTIEPSNPDYSLNRSNITTKYTKTSASHSLKTQPNTALSQAERIAKRNLKKHLKQKIRIKKYETRLHQAISRGDDKTADRARNELQAYHQRLRDDPESVMHQPGFGDIIEHREEETHFVAKSRQWLVKHIYQPLVLKIIQVENHSTTKQVQTDHARALCYHMTKGTQTEQMFDNDLALLGYTRQKFVERAVLAVTSLERGLEASLSVFENNNAAPSFWKDRLLAMETIASIGCGPGCDAVGVMAFLRQQTASVKEIVLIDYVMPQWKRLVVDSLVELVVPRFVPQIHLASCDVRFPLSHASNESAPILLEGVDCIVVSYLLTETRGKWNTFFKELLQFVSPMTVLLMSEPTAWQLHLFLNQFSQYILEHKWVDSSRDTPELQGLENRMGPAVLLVCTR